MATPAAQSRPPSAKLPEPEVLQVPPDSDFVASLTKGELRAQVEVARAFPRVISQFISNTRQMALLDEETAASCFYALPRRDGEEDRTIEGPSIRFAEIINNAWGHMRVEGRVVDELDRFVVSRGTAWDVQVNNIIAYEVRRRIVGRPSRLFPTGRRYSDDMIAVTANAAASIAIRDAILRVIPQPLWRQIWLEAKRLAVGDGTTLSKRRKEMLDYFQKLGIKPERTLAVVEAQTEADITLEKLTVLRGLATAIKDGQTTVDDAFPEIRPGTGPVAMPQRAETPQPNTGAPSAPAGASDVAAPSATPPSPASDLITVTFLEAKPKRDGGTYWVVSFSNGVSGCTFSTSMHDALAAARASGAGFADVKHHTKGDWTYIDALVPAGGAQ